VSRLTNKFLAHFNKPFSVKIHTDMGLTFTMPDGYTSDSPQRLSGAQRSILSVAFRFAVNEQFAKHLGLLVMDEPTAWMDQDNVTLTGAMIRKIQQVGSSSGVQTIIITHAAAIRGDFEKVIDLTPVTEGQP